MPIKGINGVSDTTPGTVAVQLNRGARCAIDLGSGLVEYVDIPGRQTVIVVPAIDARNIDGFTITSPGADLDFSPRALA